MTASVRRLVPVFVLLLLAACPDPKRSGSRPDRPLPGATGTSVDRPTTGTSEDPAAVVATVSGEPVTLGEVDAEISELLVKAQHEYRMAVYEARRSAIERMVTERLLREEAKRLGLADDEALIEEVVEKNTPEPTEAELQQFWELSKSDPRLAGRSYEEVGPLMKQFLHGQKKQQAFMELVERLRDGAAVDISLQQPRVQVEAVGHAKGPEDAPVTIVIFSDFECPYCSRAVPVIKQIETVYAGKVRMVFRDFPLPFHPKAPKAAEAARCAGSQGQFWPMHDLLFENQSALELENLKEHARKLEGLDAEKFDACLDSGEMADAVEADLAAGRAAGVEGTPAFFINGVVISGAQPYDAFREVIDAELASARPAASATP